MPRFLMLLILLSPFALVEAETVEIDIHGMSCAFCVEGLQKQLSKLPDIAQVDVSLKRKKVRIESKGEELDMERVRKAIVDAGFTPVESRTITNDQG